MKKEKEKTPPERSSDEQDIKCQTDSKCNDRVGKFYRPIENAGDIGDGWGA